MRHPRRTYKELTYLVLTYWERMSGGLVGGGGSWWEGDGECYCSTHRDTGAWEGGGRTSPDRVSAADSEGEGVGEDGVLQRGKDLDR